MQTPYSILLENRINVWISVNKSATIRIILCHGTNEHSGRHTNHISFCEKENIDLVRFDFRGHGLSKGPRTYVETFQDYVDDLNLVAFWQQSALETKLPTYILGHSLGSIVAVHFLNQNPSFNCAGLICDAPAFGPHLSVPNFLIQMFKSLKHVAPRMQIKTGWLISRSVSSDPAVVESHRNDPLVSHWNSVRQGVELVEAMHGAREQITLLKTSVLFLHGSSDQLTSPRTTEELYKLCPVLDKQFFLIPNGYHELHNDTLVKDRYFELVKDWLSRKDIANGDGPLQSFV